MNPLRWLSALLLALAVVAGASLWLQRQAGAALRDEIVLLREENRELARLRGENQRLVAAQAPAAELERLRADRAAVVRLRDEMEKLKAKTDDKARSVAQASAPLIPVLELKNAGRTSPRDAAETLMWARARRDLDLVAASVSFDSPGKPEADAAFAALPEPFRVQHGSVERLVAHFLMLEPPPLAMRIIDEKLLAGDRVTLAVRTQDQSGAERISRVPLQRTDAGWQMVVPVTAVQGMAAKLAGQTQVGK